MADASSHPAPQTRGLIEDGIAVHWHLGAQLYASIHGESAVDLAVGESRPGVAMASNTLLVWKSSTKPVVAAAVMQCVERGELDLDAPVADVIPEFGQGGKGAVTTHHVLTHTGGFREADFAWPDDPWARIIEAICAQPIEDGWTPGRTAGYHSLTSWFILGELIQRVTGEYFPDYMREFIFEPLGMTDCWIGMPGDAFARYDEGGRIGMLPSTMDGQFDERLNHTHDWLVNCSPGANGIGPMDQLARFYEMLLGGGALGGARVLDPQTVEHKLHRHREGVHDDTFGTRMDWGLGVLLDHPDRRGRMPYGYGRHASPRTYGHSGVQSSAAFADPEHGLAVAVAFAGMPGERAHQQRIDTVLTALYEDLGLA